MTQIALRTFLGLAIERALATRNVHVDSEQNASRVSISESLDSNIRVCADHDRAKLISDIVPGDLLTDRLCFFYEILIINMSKLAILSMFELLM